MTQLQRRTILAGVAGAGVMSLAGTVRARAADDVSYSTREAFERAAAVSTPPVGDNEGGAGLAWNTSYVMLALLRMFQATDDRSYLDRAIDQMDQVWLQTDKARGVTDFAGRSGDVWRAGGNYTSGAAVIRDLAGQDLFEIRYAWRTPTAATAEVVATQHDEFSLVLRHPQTGATTISGLTVRDGVAEVVRRVNEEAYGPTTRWSAKSLTKRAGLKTPVSGVSPCAQQYYVFAVHTGMITYPIAMFCRLVLARRALSRYRVTALRYLSRLRRSVAFHDGEWRTSAVDGLAGEYWWPTGSPLPFDGSVLPFNQAQALGQTIVELHRVHPRHSYEEKVSAILAAARQDRRRDRAAFVWNYWPSHALLHTGYSASSASSEYTPWHPVASPPEDLSHGAITAEFFVAARRGGFVVPDAELIAYAATYTQNLQRSADSLNGDVSGAAAATTTASFQAGRWAPVAPWGGAIPQHIEGVYRRIKFSPNSGSHALGIAYLVWAANKGWIND